MAHLSSIMGTLCAVGLLLAGCGSDGGDECSEPGTWSFRSVDMDEISTHPSLAFANDGTLHIVYSWNWFDDGEPAPEEYGGVVWLHGAGGDWDRETISDTPTAGAASVTASDDRLHLLWSQHDLYYRERVGDAWSGPAVNLTGAIESAPAASPGIAVGPDGALALVYYLWEGPDRPSSIRLAWIEDGSIAGEPVTLLERDRGCVATGAGFDPAGVLSVGARCKTGDETWTLTWIDVRPDGSVTAEALWAMSSSGPHMAITSDGVAHAVWTTADDAGLFHARRTGGSWSEPTRVAPSARTGQYGMATRGDEAVAFYVEDGADQRVTFLSSQGGQPLAPDCERLPDLVADGWWSRAAFDPADGDLATVTWEEDAGSWAVASLQL